MTFLLESLLACALFTLFVFLMSRNPVKTIFNYPRPSLNAAGRWASSMTATVPADRASMRRRSLP